MGDWHGSFISKHFATVNLKTILPRAGQSYWLPRFAFRLPISNYDEYLKLMKVAHSKS
jgi:hypothetical protein